MGDSRDTDVLVSDVKDTQVHPMLSFNHNQSGGGKELYVDCYVLTRDVKFSNSCIRRVKLANVREFSKPG